MRHAFLLTLMLTLTLAKPTLALAVLRSTPERPLVPTCRLSLPPPASQFAALRSAVRVPPIAGPADHHQPVTASAAELSSIVLLGDVARVFDDPPGRIEPKLDPRSAVCETRVQPTPFGSSAWFRGRRFVFQDCVRRPRLFRCLRGTYVATATCPKSSPHPRNHATRPLAHGITRIPVIADTRTTWNTGSIHKPVTAVLRCTSARTEIA